MPLRIAIVHYHLKAGGVTRVIENAVAGLSGHEIKTAVLSGEPYSGVALENTRAVEGLGYCSSSDAPAPVVLAERMRETAIEALGGAPDIWHIHNHSLGKNPALPGAVSNLAANGGGMLLQIHDFAEDGRPANYAALDQAELLYPQAPRIHYAVLNGRDARFLAEAGFPTDRLHLLANPVAVPGDVIGREQSACLPGVDRLFVYPTRGIRRKNLGEMLLWAAMAEHGDFFATTLSPANPAWLEIHERWKVFASRLKLPAKFGVTEAGNQDFLHWVIGAHALVTTSVAEGFGLAFLEPWLFGKPLVGRDLPAITADFREAGVDLSGLYDRLDIPVELVGAADLKLHLENALRAYYSAYSRDLSPEAIVRCQAAVVRNDTVDFGCLDEPLQERVIEAVLGSLYLKNDIHPRSLRTAVGEETIAHNRMCINERFSLEVYGRRLAGVYVTIATAPEERLDHLKPQLVLDRFLSPEGFRLLRN